MDYDYFSNHYKLIVIALSKQNDLENPDLKQQINLIRRLEEDNVTIIIEELEETTFHFTQNSVTVV